MAVVFGRYTPGASGIGGSSSSAEDGLWSYAVPDQNEVFSIARSIAPYLLEWYLTSMNVANFNRSYAASPGIE